MSNKKCNVQYEVQIKYTDDEIPDMWSNLWIMLNLFPEDHPMYRPPVDGWPGDMRSVFDDQETAMFIYDKLRELAKKENLDDRVYRVVRVNTRELISEETSSG